MSGHNKWSSIKHKKAIVDAKRGKAFTKVIKEITVAARLGGGDPASNARLRVAIEKAKAENMPQDNIVRAVKKGSGELAGVNYEEFTYEGYGPEGVAVLVNVLTDNKNRTVGELRRIFAKSGGNLGETGCVAWMFDKKGYFYFPPDVDGDGLVEAALQAGAEDVVELDGDGYEVYSDASAFSDAQEAFANAGFSCDQSRISMIPQTTVPVEGSAAEKVLRFMELLEDHDDVQDVFANFDISDDEMERLAG